MDPNAMRRFAAKVPKNKLTGRVDMHDIMRYMEENPAEMEMIMSQVEQQQAEMSAKVSSLSTFDWNSLGGKNIRDRSFWVLQMETMDYMVGPDGSTINDMRIGSNTAGALPVFQLYCYDDQSIYRVTQESRGLPDSDKVLETIKKAIALPLPPEKPELPWLFVLSSKLGQHASALRPFLDSLPEPFHWRVETAEEAQGVADGVYAKNRQGTLSGLEHAEVHKTRGKKAFEKKQRKEALEAYAEAIEALKSALAQRPEDDEEKKGLRMLAVCYSNRAATHLLPGSDQQASKALHDGESAVRYDPSYSKGYIRQVRAYEHLGQKGKAMDCLATALRREDLKDDAGLADMLIVLYTDGKGLSKDEATFKQWMLDIMLNDKASSQRIGGLQGAWRDKMDAQFAKFKRD